MYIQCNYNTLNGFMIHHAKGEKNRKLKLIPIINYPVLKILKKNCQIFSKIIKQIVMRNTPRI